MKLAGTGPIGHDKHGPYRELLTCSSGITSPHCSLRWNGSRWAKGEPHMGTISMSVILGSPAVEVLKRAMVLRLTELGVPSESMNISAIIDGIAKQMHTVIVHTVNLVGTITV